MPTNGKSNAPGDGCEPARQLKSVPLRLARFACVALTGLAHLHAQTASQGPGKPPNEVQATAATAYWERTDRFEEKMKLIESAWQRKDFDLARALIHSLRNTAIQAQAEEQEIDPPVAGATQYKAVESLPPAWRDWAQGWKLCKAIAVEETLGQDRLSEPVEIVLGFPAEQAAALTRELRLARVAEGELREVPCQVYGEVRRGGERLCKLLFMADCPARQKQLYFVFYGNPDAELPQYPSDLDIQGEGFGLDVENAFYKASLSRQTGQL